MNKALLKKNFYSFKRILTLKVFLRISFLTVLCFLTISCYQIKSHNSAENLPSIEIQPTQKTNKKTASPTPPVDSSKNINTEPTNFPSPENEEILKTDIDPMVIGKLKIPVVGIRHEDLHDTFKDSRSEGRIHDAIDITAAEDTPVVAAADGEIARFFDSERGGITIYQFSSDRKLVFYYAHLKRRAENLQEKMPVKQGQVIGYVGDTGNAGTGNFHLHFAIWYVTDPKKYWDGLNINPYPLLH